jgi:hypothetical protein
MKSNERNRTKRVIGFCLLAFALSGFVTDEPKIPEGPPPPELIGRWLEKTSDRKGDLVGYNIYVFSRKSEFFVASMARNEKTKRWVNSNNLYPKDRPRLSGYFEVKTPGSLTFDIVVLGMAVLPLETKYSVRERTLSLSKNMFNPTGSMGVKCEHVERLPNESKKDALALGKRIEDGLNGPEFRQMFERAAHEMKDHPSDEAMITNFDDHREEFENLRVMMQADKNLQRVAPDFIKPPDLAAAGVSAERIEQYRGLAKKLGLERGVEGYDSATRVALLASCRGLSISGSSKTYVWLGAPPEPIEGRAVVFDLDEYVRKRREERRKYFDAHKHAMSGHVDAYRHIEGNWYLHYED